MSKASDWVEKLNDVVSDKPCLRANGAHGEGNVTARVSGNIHNVECWIEQESQNVAGEAQTVELHLSDEQAVRLGSWLIDTFGEPERRVATVREEKPSE